ncbi:MAG TPA: PilZ domain-containing protein [Gemmataceae bacterium]|nr:PilZ domain-containing protein [Gemmataceae bacterium]
MAQPQTLQQIEQANPAPHERRAWVRYPCDLETACQPLAGARGLQWPGKIRNVSAGGVALRLARRFEAGTVLAIDVQGRDESIMCTLLARVIHVLLQSDGSWLLGCAFTNTLSEDDLKALL